MPQEPVRVTAVVLMPFPGPKKIQGWLIIALLKNNRLHPKPWSSDRLGLNTCTPAQRDP